MSRFLKNEVRGRLTVTEKFLPRALPLMPWRTPLPVIAWMHETLLGDDNQHVARSYFHDALQADFGDMIEKQLGIAIHWARHAELFACDDGTGELYIEG